MVDDPVSSIEVLAYDSDAARVQVLKFLSTEFDAGWEGQVTAQERFGLG